MEKIVVYVDNCILSRIIDLRFKKSTGVAIEKLCDLDEVEMVTSSKTLDEFLNTTEDKKRTALRLLFKLISKIKKKEPMIFYPATFGGVPFGTATFGGGYSATDPVFEKINKIFDKDDSDHIYQAFKNGCQYFLTLDKETILNRVKKYKKELDLIPLNMKLVDPTGLVNEISR